MIVLGVDPGCPGGWAILDRDGCALGCDLGEVEDGFLSPAMIGILSRYAMPHRARYWYSAIESFPPRPMMHVKSIAGLFAGVGAWRMAIRAASFPKPEPIEPRAWQKRFTADFKKAEASLRALHPTLSGKSWRDKVQKAHREVYHQAALALWPDQRHQLVGPKGGARHDVAAALWIAEHRRLQVLAGK